jgi:hypothetical protein
MVAAGEYDYFRVEGKANIDIISFEGATVTTADWTEDLPVVGDAWVMAAVHDSPNINIEGIDFDGTGVSGEDVVAIAYVDSTGVIAALTIENVVGTGGMGAGVVIADDAGFSDVEITGSTISDNEIGIAVATDSAQEIRFNNIVNNDLGVVNEGVGTPDADAIYNWWGHASGPLSVTNPFGEGNPVSDDVDFDPWLESRPVTDTVTNLPVYAIDEADTIVEVHGTATLTISRYPGNPYPGARIEGEGELASVNAETLQTNRVLLDDLFRDLKVTRYELETYVLIRIYYTDDQIDGIDDEGSLRACWTNEEDPQFYLECSVSDVDTTPQYDIEGKDYSGVITAVVSNNSSPNMGQLNGTTFGGYGSGSQLPPDPCGCFIATAAYGTDTAEQLDILREFRDTVLLPNRVGARFVSFYYRASPPMADFISQNDVVRTIARVGFVDPIVRILTWTHGLWSP